MEDAEDDAELMLRELHQAGVRSVSARVQTEGELIEALHSFLPDVVLSDHSLPQFTALDALHTIQRVRPGTPVIIVTGSLDEETAAAYIKAGAADYIVKHRLHRLGPAVGRAMTLRQAQREAAVAADSQLRSERRFRKLVEYSSDVITLLDGTGTVLYSTQSLKPTLGYGPGEMVGHSVFELVYPDDRPAAERLFRGVARDASITSRVDVRVRHKEGPWRDLEVAVANHLDDPDVRAMVVTYQDVTDRKRLQQQLFQAQKMEAVGRLAGGVAHDFNNLLTAILGSTDLLLETLPADHPGREEGAEIREAALRAVDLTRQLLAFSRQQVLAPRVLDLTDVVANLHKMLRRLIGDDVDLRTTLAEGLGAVRADPGQLEQVIVNLAVNARDAMPRGGQLTIETANVDVERKGDTAAVPVVESGAYVLLVVSDTGTGMDAETKARMFEPFFTTKPKGQGTGLGLATVYGIVKQSGGYVWVESEPGHGTTVKIYLPRVVADVDPQSASPEIRRLNGSETVLLVEDQEQVRELTKRLLEARGYRVLVAASGPEALRLAEHYASQIHLLVTDVVMPGMSGREVSLLLAPTHRDMRVLYLSGYPDPSVVDQGVLAPGTPFLQKPFTSEALARKVREVLDGPTST
ncbi:MAG TPA: response regulator [Gemmatimonadales bacterium]|nr:response regulator [Gemmatimonadales bacterium]